MLNTSCNPEVTEHWERGYQAPNGSTKSDHYFTYKWSFVDVKILITDTLNTFPVFASKQPLLSFVSERPFLFKMGLFCLSAHTWLVLHLEWRAQPLSHFFLVDIHLSWTKENGEQEACWGLCQDARKELKSLADTRQQRSLTDSTTLFS